MPGMQYSRMPGGVPSTGPLIGDGARAHPMGVKVEYFASVRRQTPRPITPSSMRFSKDVNVLTQQTETSLAPVFGREAGAGVLLPVAGKTPRIHPAESGSFVPMNVLDFPCGNNTPRPGVPSARPNCRQNVPFIPQELCPSISQHPRQPNLSLPKAGLDFTLPPHRGTLPHSRPCPPPGEVVSGGCVPTLDSGNVWPNARRHQHPMFSETREVFPRTNAALPPGNHEHEQMHAEDYHQEQPEDHRRYRGRSSFRPSSSATEEAEFDERQNWLPRRSWSKGHGQSSWADADMNGHLGDEMDSQTAPRKVLPLMSIKSFPTRQFSGRTYYCQSYYNHIPVRI